MWMPGARFLISLLLLPALAAAAQQPTQSVPSAGSGYTLQLNSNLVVLDVVVTDRKGNVVTNLTRDDFKVLEDSVPQTVLSFELPGHDALQLKAPIESTAELDRMAPQAPVDILVLDEINTRYEDMAFARYSLRKFLDSQPDKLREPTMLAAAGIGHFAVLQDYTQNKNAILEALKDHLAQYPWRLDGGSWKPEQFASAVAAIMQVAEATEGHAGHKNVIWVGRGFPSIRTDQLLPEEEDRLSNTIQMCVNLLRDARVTLYTVDPAGISTQISTDIDGFNADDPFGGDFDFNTLAEATGGKTFYGRNDVNAEIGTSVHDGASFYTLSYRPANNNDVATPFRKIRIVMKDPGLRAVTRQGYYVANAAVAGDKDADPVQNRTFFDLLAAADTTLVYDSVPITVTEEGSRWDIGIHVGRGALDWTQPQPGGEETAAMQLVVVVFDRSNRIIQRIARNVTVHNRGAGKDGVASQDAFIHVGLPRNLDPTRVRVVVRVPGSGKIGSANLDMSAK